ncbi:MAG: DUF1553 domain-containing protein [Planctomycetota bacterium]
MTTKSGTKAAKLDDGSRLIPSSANQDVYTIDVPLSGVLGAIKLDVLPHEKLRGGGPGNSNGGNFVLTGVDASILPPATSIRRARYVRVEVPGDGKILSLAEVQVFEGSKNVAREGAAKQSTTDFRGPAHLAIDGKTDGRYNEAKSTTHTAVSKDPWWEVDLKRARPVSRIKIWNRTDNNLQSRLVNYNVSLLDEKRGVVWEQKNVKQVPRPSLEFSISGAIPLPFKVAHADHSQAGFEAHGLVQEKSTGWAIGGATQKPHALTLIPAQPAEAPKGSKLSIRLEQLSPHKQHNIGRFKLSYSSDRSSAMLATLPAEIASILKTKMRDDAARQRLEEYFLASIAAERNEVRAELDAAKKKRGGFKPSTTVPVLRELAKGRRRTTKIQRRGNFLDTSDTVNEGVPQALHRFPEKAPKNRLSLARWLVSRENPLVARVMANRLWEQIFGMGIVRSSEEFGSQGDLPTHPELLDWLAVELVESDWDIKGLLRTLVVSSTYRQSSKLSKELGERDPDNSLYARGPRFRLSAEMIRDQALFLGGLLSRKKYGPPVKPLQPKLGVSAAFGSGIDWRTSGGEDRYRRGLYTTWRRSNPYPSMATFDAPNLEVCTVRRARTNTPLQALVTMNDPVYVEAAQGLGRLMVRNGETVDSRIEYGFRRCLSRLPSTIEAQKVKELFERVRKKFSIDVDAAMKLATQPIGALPKGASAVEMASWTVVASVLLNLDETLMKR